MAFYAGFGGRDVTPAPGTRFGGFWIERESAADGTHDPLYAHAMALGDGVNTAVVVSLDLQLVSPELVRTVREEILATHGIPAVNVMISATHDHAAPGGDAAEAYYPGFDHEGVFLPEAAYAKVRQGILGSVDDALKGMKAGTLFACSSRITGIGKSRAGDDEEQAFPATVLLFKDDGGRPAGALTNYPCHVSILGIDNRLFSADWVAVLNREISAYLNAPSMFLQGACAEVSTRRTRREQTFAEVERLGGELVRQVRPLLDSAVPVDTDGFFARCEEFHIPLRLEEVAKAFDAPAAKQALSLSAGSAPVEARRLQFMAGRFRKIVDARYDKVPTEIQVIRFGDLAFLGISAETHTSIAEAVLASTPAKFTLIVAPAGGSVGNITPEVSALRFLSPVAVEDLVRISRALLRAAYAGGADSCVEKTRI